MRCRRCGSRCLTRPRGIFDCSHGSAGTHRTSARRGELERLASGGLPSQEECFWKFPFTANFEGAEVLVPFAVRRIGFGFTPKLEPVQIFDRYFSLFKPIKSMLAQGRWKIIPLNLRHQAPNVMRASSFLIRRRSAGSVESDNRFASAKNLSFSDALDSRPASIKSTRTRFALVFRVFAMTRTCLARRAGRETLWRTAFSVLAMSQFYTSLHHSAPL